MDTTQFSFFRNETQLQFYSSRDNRDAFLQWNLDACLKIEKFRFTGHLTSNSTEDYLALLREFFQSSAVTAAIDAAGSAQVPVAVDAIALGTSVMSMDFFDRLLDGVAPNGNIRGCYEETFDGLLVGDQLREMLVNESSENAHVFSAEDQNQFIFRLFKLIACGGSMCQTDPKIDRYLDVTKALYKEAITIYRDSKTGLIEISGKVFDVRSVSGLQLFANPDSMHNALYVVVDPLKKELFVIKKEFRSFW